MGRREQARSEAAFMRGDTGVDGQATEERRDVAEIERSKAREQFLRGKAWLGREMLTWLLWRTESGEPLLEVDGTPLSAIFTGRLTLRGIAGEVTELTVKGAEAPYSVLVRQAIARGLLLCSARLQLTHGEKSYEVTLDAEHLDVRGAKLPELMTEEEDDQLQERLYLVEQLSMLISALLEDYLKLRSSKRWRGEVVPAIKAWLEEEPHLRRGEAA
jgi:hypothetical protein